MNTQVKVFKDKDDLNNFAAKRFVEIANESIENRDCFTVSLAGGSTPKSLYQLLASEKFRDKVDWTKVFFFFGDERNVLPNESESNFRMANENLFEPLQIVDKNIFRWQTEIGNAEKIAESYEETLRSFFGGENNPPATAGGSDRFDLILLGMGADGHTASLFPYTEAVRTACGSGRVSRIAVANYVEKLQTTRLTLTFPFINNAENVIFLVAGEEKAETLRDVLEGEYQPEKLPSQSVQPRDGNLLWLVDEKTASLLRHK